jgi:geranylgeranyl reductase family protein
MFHLKIKPPVDFDVVVVGAGPAGASAATHIARSGFKVALIDQNTFPRDKVCGDFVGPVALLELQSLGVVNSPGYQETNIIHSASVFLDGKQLINSLIPEVPNLPSYGRVVQRKQLDAWIVATAQAAGAQLIESYRVKRFITGLDDVTVYGEQRGQERTLHARLLIGADGSSSLVARQMHKHNPSSQDRIIAVRTYYEGVTGPPDQADLYFSSESFPGYYWLFPTGEKTANVGIGMLHETLPTAKERLPELLERLIKIDPAFGERLQQAHRTSKVSGWPLSTYNPASPLAADRVLLVGDAAGLINPLNGEGIQYALLSGRWAAETVVEADRQDDYSMKALEAYTQHVRSELSYDMALASLIVELIRNRSMNPIWMQALRVIVSRARANPAYADVTGGVLAGLVPARQVIQPPIIGGTIQQAAFSIGVGTVKHILRGPKHMLQFGLRSARSGVEIAGQVGQQPWEYLKWGSEVASSAVSLAGQVVGNLIPGKEESRKEDDPVSFHLKFT